MCFLIWVCIFIIHVSYFICLMWGAKLEKNYITLGREPLSTPLGGECDFFRCNWSMYVVFKRMDKITLDIFNAHMIDYVFSHR